MLCASIRQRDFCFTSNQGNSSPSNTGLSQEKRSLMQPLAKRTGQEGAVGFWKKPTSLLLPCNAVCSGPAAEEPAEGGVHLLLCHFHLLACSSFCPTSCLKGDPSNTHTFTQLNTIPRGKREILCWCPHHRSLLQHSVLRGTACFPSLHLLVCHLAQKAKSAQPLLLSSAMAEELRGQICKEQLFSAATEHWH